MYYATEMYTERYFVFKELCIKLCMTINVITSILVDII